MAWWWQDGCVHEHRGVRDPAACTSVSAHLTEGVTLSGLSLPQAPAELTSVMEPTASTPTSIAGCIFRGLLLSC